MKKSLKNTLAILLVISTLIIQLAVCASAFEKSSKLGGIVNSAESKYSLADGGTLITYNAPQTLGKASEIYASKPTVAERSMLPLAEYDKIGITASGHPIFVYATGVAVEHGWYDQTDYTLEQRYTPVAYFDFNGSVDIEIDVSEMAELCTDASATLAEFTTATVSPLSRGVTAQVSGNIVSFTITQHGDYTVVLGDNERTAIHIFANEIDSPDLGDNIMYVKPGDTSMPDGWESASAVVFMPGDYQWGNREIYMQSHQTIYLMGGAVVHSNVRFDNGVTNARLSGRGIIDDSESPSWKIEDGNPRHVPIQSRYCKDIAIDGITILNPCLWAIQLYEAENVTINNVHIITGKHNGDGISVQSSANVAVTNSFVRSWDDSLVVKNYSETNSSDIKFSNITLWTDLAQSMEIGYETNNSKKENAEISDVTFENITVIYNLHKPIISIHNADNAYVHDIIYKNIVVENANMGKGDSGDNVELIELSNSRLNQWASTETRGKISDILIEDFTVLKTDREKNFIRIEGYDRKSKVEDVTLKHINVAGKELTVYNKNNSDLKLIKNRFVRGIKIISSKMMLADRLIIFFDNLFERIKNIFTR